MPDKNTIRYDHGLIEQGALSIQAFTKNMHEAIETMHRKVSPAVARWEGGAKKTYEDRHNAWNYQVDELHDTLLNFVNATRRANENMGDTDKWLAKNAFENIHHH